MHPTPTHQRTAVPRPTSAQPPPQRYHPPPHALHPHHHHQPHQEGTVQQGGITSTSSSGGGGGGPQSMTMHVRPEGFSMEVQGMGGIPEGGAMAQPAHVPSHASRNSGEHASQQDQAHRSPTAPSAHATTNPTATTTTTPTTVRREVELTDAGTRLKLQGKLDEGMSKYLAAIRVNPSYAPAYYNIGVIYSELNRYEEALQYYNAAIQHNKFYVEAYCNVGVIYKNVGQLEAAITFYDKARPLHYLSYSGVYVVDWADHLRLQALSINPNFAIAKSNMAIALTDYGTFIKNQGKRAEAIQYYQKALTYNVQYPDAFYNLGVAYGEMGSYDKAIICYELAIHFNPFCCEAFNNLGVIYKDRDNLDKAIECYRSALSINPTFAQTLNNLSVVYTVQGKLDEAYAMVKAAIEVNPQYAEALNNKGVLYRDEGKIKKAIACYDRCLALNPQSRNASQNRLLAMNYLPEGDLETIYLAHKQWGEDRCSKTVLARHRSDHRYDRIVRIGYVSPDFFTHSVSYFIEGILAHHDKSKFMVFCYSNVVKEDAKTQKIKQLAHAWRNIYGKSADEAAAMIVSDQIDILVDLTGHTAGNRLDIMALKPAPVQVTYIGYPNTTGLPTIDYRFTDAITDPPDTSQRYVEELIRLPNCFLCYTPSPDAGEVAPAPFIKNGYVTFGSFNNLAKINKHVIKLWAQVLLQVPKSRMVIKCKPFACDAIRGNFLKRLQSEGIEPSRVDLLPLIPLNHDHLQAYSHMDISLDTFPYAGTTTTCEALWMGVPVVTLVGDSHAHNVGATILRQVGLEELIARTKEDYVAAALRLATDPHRLQSIRSTLRVRMQQSYMCSPLTFTRNIEQAYSSIWRKHCLQHSRASSAHAEQEEQQHDDGDTSAVKKVKIAPLGTSLPPPPSRRPP